MSSAVSSYSGVDHSLIRVALDDLVAGIVAAPGSLTCQGHDESNVDVVLQLGALGRRLAPTIDFGTSDVFVGLSECDERLETVAIDGRLDRIEKSMAVIEGKLDCLLQRMGGVAPDGVVDGRSVDLMTSFSVLREVVCRSIRDGDRIRGDNAYKTQVVEEMADGADKFMAGLVGRIETQGEREFFFLLIHRENVSGTKKPLTYEEIGKRLGGLTKQAAFARSKEFRHKYPVVWAYVMTIRRPERADNFSELSPSERREHGIDKSYDHAVS